MLKAVVVRFLVIVQLLVAGGVVFAGESTSRALVVGSEQDYPPFALGQTDATADGFTVELWKAVAKEAGLNYTIHVRPFHQILQEFNEGKIDVLINLAQSDERRKFADFSIPHVTVNGAIFVRKGESGIRSEADFAGKSIIVLHADLAHDYAVSRGWGQQLVLTDKAADGFRLLASGKHDAMLISKLAGMQTLHELKITNVTALDAKAGFSQKFSFAVHKGDAELLAKINEGLALTKPSGTFDVLYEKWFGPYEVKPVAFWDVLRYLAPIAIILIAFAGYEFYKRQVERSRSRAALHQCEARFRAIIDTSPTPLVLNDNKGNITYLNSSFIQIVGYTIEEIPTLDIWWSLAYPDQQYRQQVADTWKNHLEESLRSGKPFAPVEANITCKDGIIRIFSVNASMVLEDAEGTHLVALYDITDRIAAEKELLENNQLLDSIVDNIPNMIFLKRATDLRFEMFNRAGEELLGRSRDELIGRNDYDFFSREQADFFTSKDRFALQQINVMDIPEEYIETPLGKRILHTKKLALKNEYGQPTHLLGISEDITERMQASEQLQKLLTEQKAILESELVGIAKVKDRVIVWNNATYEKMMGYNKGELIGASTRVLCASQEAYKALGATAYPVIQSGNVYRSEMELVHKDSRLIWMDISGVMLDDSAGISLWTIIDIKERKQAEKALLNAKDMAESLAQSKSEFLANMSHEIRTPMNGIIGLVQLALNQPTTPQLRDYLQKISSSSQSLLGILNDILDFSKMEAGRMSIENVPFDLDQLMDNLRNLFEERAEAKHLDFAIEIAEGTPRNLIGGAMRIQQILSNLLGNAIKFTEQGHVALKIEVKQLAGSQAQLSFAVEDTGLGITKEDLGKLFHPFSQVDGSITRRFGGTGLGLAISHKLLQLMGGDFDVISQPGQGTTFSFNLVFGIAEPGHVRESRHRIKHKAGELEHNLEQKGSALKGARILVAEDNSINQQVVKEFLKLSGMEVAIADNGQEALDLLEHQDFDAILMDVHMPVMDGLEATKRIRANPDYADLPIIALTAGVTQEEREGSRSAGMNDFVAKPVNPEALVAALVKWVKPNVGS